MQWGQTGQPANAETLLRLELSMCLHFQKQLKVLLCEQGEEKAQYLHQAQASKRHSQYGTASVAV